MLSCSMEFQVCLIHRCCQLFTICAVFLYGINPAAAQATTDELRIHRAIDALIRNGIENSREVRVRGTIEVSPALRQEACSLGAISPTECHKGIIPNDSDYTSGGKVLPGRQPVYRFPFGQSCSSMQAYFNKNTAIKSKYLARFSSFGQTPMSTSNTAPTGDDDTVYFGASCSGGKIVETMPTGARRVCKAKMYFKAHISGYAKPANCAELCPFESTITHLSWSSSDCQWQ
jgi:hypothetical protein